MPKERQIGLQHKSTILLDTTMNTKKTEKKDKAIIIHNTHLQTRSSIPDKTNIDITHQNEPLRSYLQQVDFTFPPKI